MRFPLYLASTGITQLCLRPIVFQRVFALFAASFLVGLPAHSQTVLPTSSQEEATSIAERKAVIANLAESKASLDEKVAVLLQPSNRIESPLKAQMLNRKASSQEPSDNPGLPPMRVNMERAFRVATELELELASFKREVAERITALNARKLTPEERVEAVVEFFDLAKGAFEDAAEVQKEIKQEKKLRKTEEVVTKPLDSTIQQLRQKQAELRAVAPSEAVALLLDQAVELRSKNAANPLLRNSIPAQPASSTQSR